MKDPRRVDDLSVAELQRALLEKKRLAREARLEQYRRTGRALPMMPVGEPAPALPALTAPRPRSWLKRALDAVLVLVEVAAVAGLLYVLANGVGVLRELNTQTAAVIAQSVQAVPTLAPTPLVTAVVLPGGHTPPDPRTGQSQFNAEEIPANVRPMVQAMPAPVIPTASPRQAMRIVIPRLNVDAPIVQGDGWEQLKKGVGQHIGSADPGQRGNMVLSAHNDIYGEIFRHLDQLIPGDVFHVYTTAEMFTYVVTGTQIVQPTDVWVLRPTDHASSTLISCYPYLVSNQRIVVFADLQTP